MTFCGPGAALAALILTLGAMTIGCGEKTTQGPPEVHYGEDICAACGMIISDQRFAGAIVTLDGQRRRRPFLYDDIGGMAADAANRSSGADDEMYVHDYISGEWIDAKEGFFVRSEALSTPMAWGVAAFRSRTDAQAMMDRIGGELFTWRELRSLDAKQTKPAGSD